MTELQLSAIIGPSHGPQSDCKQAWQGRAMSWGPRRAQNPGLQPPSPAALRMSVEEARDQIALNIPEKNCESEGKTDMKGAGVVPTAFVSRVTGETPKGRVAGARPLISSSCEEHLTAKPLAERAQGRQGPGPSREFSRPLHQPAPTAPSSPRTLPADTPAIMKSDPGGTSKGISHEVLHSHVCGNRGRHPSFPE